MDFGLDTFINWQTALFAFGVYSFVLLIRRVVEFSFKQVKGADWWKLVLSILPGALGLSAGVWLSTFPYPEVLMTRAGRGVYGLVIGMASGVIYRIVKKAIKNRFPGAFDEDAPSSSGKT